MQATCQCRQRASARRRARRGISPAPAARPGPGTGGGSRPAARPPVRCRTGLSDPSDAGGHRAGCPSGGTPARAGPGILRLTGAAALRSNRPRITPAVRPRELRAAGLRQRRLREP
ncbi:hypothetical protein ISF6_4480 [Piscinibacter sakaiensis]|uniref:Uncharacterized protein n=1 Tax=Piscinibacter sakaiensis TaxID=1547922 RepID=A0A0K8NWI8_PISS1|nr:hypothetical protein ISF6_4480 [Piscinibacter sakaiensis]